MPKVRGPDAHVRTPAPSREFRLTRFYSVASLLGISLVTVCLILAYRGLTERHLVAHESRANADLTRAFANTVWSRHRDFVLGPSGRSREALLADARLPQLRADVLAQMKGLKIAKVKIYNPDGLTVFSTDEGQIGEDKAANEGFRRARAGEVASAITHREKFDAFEGVINNRDLIASYIPIRTGPQAPVEGVFEVYSDVTELLQKQWDVQWQVAGLVFGLLAMLYLFLFLLVRKADRILQRQESERLAQEEEVRHQAYHDPLTGLPNRAYFRERLGETLAIAARHRHTCALMFMDLDRFKIVNDSLGHPAGDALLKAVSERIQESLRTTDVLFRMGGDEFTVILPQIAAPEDAAVIARRVLEAVAPPVPVHEHELTVTATVGIAVYPVDGETPEALLKNADAAMYSAKQACRGTYAFYRADMNQRALQRLAIEAALKKGFRDGEFALYYQPRIDAATRRVVALEALLRWNSLARGVVLPDDFVGVLEDMGMMNIVGEWVLRTACAQVRRWHDAGQRLRVSINVSAVQFQGGGLAQTMERVLRDTGAPAELIELELTESFLLPSPEQARRNIDALRALGLRIAIDDFGTGYSSLNYLRQFSVDILKIDRTFIMGIAESERDREVAKAIVELARALRITVVAEGVESAAQAEFFTGLACGELQGFLFCKPLPVELLEQFLSASGALRQVA